MVLESRPGPQKLDIYRREVGGLINRLKIDLRQGLPDDPETFDLRGGLYRKALDIAPHARVEDIRRISGLLNARPGERSVDVAAGTGFLTVPLATWTETGPVYAVDTSRSQLDALEMRAGNLPILTVHGSFSEPETVSQLGSDVGNIDIVTSFAGIHHMTEEGQQRRLFEQVGRVLRPGGRFVAADVSAGTKLADHFDTSVTEHCLTSHKAAWLSPKRVRDELTPGTGLEVVSAEVVTDHVMLFDSVAQMALWAKALHAYDLPEEQIVDDLQTRLGFIDLTGVGGEVRLTWPLLFFKLEKPVT